MKDKMFLGITFFYVLVYFFWRVFFSLPFGAGMLALVLGILLLICEAVGIIQSLGNMKGAFQNYNPVRPFIEKAMYPDVDILIATHNEPVELLYKTVNGCLYMDYPDQNKKHIYLCDDGNRDSVAELAKKMGVGYFGLEKNQEAKAGNLNNAIFKTHSPIIVTLDADMIPMSHFLKHNVPYFFIPTWKRNEEGKWEKRKKNLPIEIGFVQTPQSFYNTDLFQYNLFLEKHMPNEQDYFFRQVNVGRNRSNSAIYAGSNTIISRKALESIGGIVTGTITEDMATGIEIQKAGYRCYSVDEVSASGLTPLDVESLIKQRIRWGRGCIDIMKKKHFLLGKNGKGLSAANRFSYLRSYLYWYSYLLKFFFIIFPPIVAILGVTIMHSALWQILFIYIPMYLLSSFSVVRITKRSRSDFWSNITMTVISPYMILPLLKETVGLREHKFYVTQKDRKENMSQGSLKKAYPHLMMLVLAIVGLGFTIYRMMTGYFLGYTIVMFWIIKSIYDLILSIFFMIGRKNLRHDERLYRKEQILIKSDGHMYHTETLDISESGFSVCFSLPVYVEPEAEVIIILQTEQYKASMHAALKNAEQIGEKWKYSFQITSMEEKDRGEYLQILYDHMPALPQKVEESMSFYDNLKQNIKKRTGQEIGFRRELPRCSIEQEIIVDEQKIYVKNFNYRYVLLKAATKLDTKLRLPITKEFLIEVEYYECIEEKADSYIYLYKICNPETLYYDPQIASVLQQMTNAYRQNRIKQEKEQKKYKRAKEELVELSLFGTKTMLVLLICFFMLFSKKVYAQEALNISGTYQWSDTATITTTQQDQAYRIDIQNNDIEKNDVSSNDASDYGYGEAGFLFGEPLYPAETSQIGFQIENQDVPLYFKVGLLSGDSEITWLDTDTYIAYNDASTKELLLMDSDMFQISEERNGTYTVDLSEFDLTQDYYVGMVLAFVVPPKSQSSLILSDIESYGAEDAVVPSFGTMAIQDSLEVDIPVMGERTYAITIPKGWSAVPFKEDGLYLDETGILHVTSSAEKKGYDAVLQNEGWDIHIEVTSDYDTDYNAIKNFTVENMPELQVPALQYLGKIIKIGRIILLSVFVLVFLIYIYIRNKNVWRKK